MKKWIIPGLVVIAAAGAWGVTRLVAGDGTGYRFVAIERGDIVSAVSSTGTLQATRTVEVGTQVSGQISEIYVDFNDRVTENQLVARIDPTILEQEVRSAEASLERSSAELDYRRSELGRIERLHEAAAATDTERALARYQHATAEASYKSAEIGLERARRNLSYTEIRSPIGGIVVERTVDVGQTVAASFSAPQLFLIAEDLSSLEILAAVDESDIGKIHEGQEVRFTVQTYPDETFTGTADQVRLQSASQENVVNYTVVIAVENAGGRLLPGMTATVDFIVEKATGVLKVPNVALRFRPTAKMQAEMRKQSGAGSAGARAGAASDSLRSARRAAAAAGAGDRALLWYVTGDGKTRAVRVTTGVTDGQTTEVRGDELQEGMQIIAAVTDGASSSTATNPFHGSQSQGLPPPPAPGM